MNDNRFSLARLAALTTCMLINLRLDAGEIREIVAFGASESVSVFTDGPTWIEYVASDLGVPLKNFATGAGGGTSSADTGQIRSYWQRNEPAPGTLFAAWHWGVGGDLLAGISASQAANGAITNVNTLVDAGASQFLIPNNYPLFPTIVPFLRDSANAADISADLDVARGLVEEGLRDLEAMGEITIYRTDWDKPFNSVIQDPLEFGFTNVTDPFVHATEGNPDEYMWWDTVHWTSAMHRLVADNVLSSIAEPRAFASYFRLVATGPMTFDSLFEQGPFPEQLGGYSPPGTPLPGWDGNVEASFLLGGDPPTVDPATLIATIPLNDTLTSIARDGDGNELGRIVTLGVGSNRLDLNADRAVVDDDAGTIQVQFGGSLLGGSPSATLSVIEATGIYASEVVVVGDGLGSAGGYFLFPLDDDPDTSLQENILNAFADGQIMGLDVVGVWAGHYVPEPSTRFMLASSALLLMWTWRSLRLEGRNPRQLTIGIRSR